MKRVTIRDIANKAGVSHATVSMALRNQRKIPEKTRERIKELAKAMGYVPDPALGRLNVYRRFSSEKEIHSALAWIDYWDESAKKAKSPTILQYRRGAEIRAAELGFKIEEFALASGDLSFERFTGIAKSRGIIGLLVPPHRLGNNRRLEIPWEDFTTVRFGHSGSYIPSHIVGNDQYATAFDAIEKCSKLGFKSVGYYFHHYGEEMTRYHFLGGYMTGCYKYFPDNSIPPFIPTNQDQEKHRELFLKWYREYVPEVVITQHSQVYYWLMNEGIDVPKDVKLVHIALPVVTDVRFSGMHQNSIRIGEQAVDLLARLLRHGEYGIPDSPLEVNVKSNWQDGYTT